MVVLLTGVGTRLLDQALETRYPAGRFAEALRRLTVVARGPKPMAVLREMNVPAILVPEPNTWREVLATTEGRPERRIAVQEYGKSNPELLDAFRARGAEVTAVRIYQWDLPEDTAPLREAVRRVAAGEFGVALFTTSIQVAHLLRVAADAGVEQEVRDGLANMIVASIGPTTSEALEEDGVHVDFEPSHPKMGVLVQETAGHVAALEKEKR
jgi:uroporphyrinogen-III synthase